MSNVLEYKGYHGTVEYDAEDCLLFGHVIGVNDVLAYHGSSVDELTQYFQNCIDGYLETCEALGRQPDKEYKGSFNVRITPELHKLASIEAEKQGISLNQFVQNAIELKLNPSLQQTSYVVLDSITVSNAIQDSFLTSPNRYKDAIPFEA